MVYFVSKSDYFSYPNPYATTATAANAFAHFKLSAIFGTYSSSISSALAVFTPLTASILASLGNTLPSTNAYTVALIFTFSSAYADTNLSSSFSTAYSHAIASAFTLAYNHTAAYTHHRCTY